MWQMPPPPSVGGRANIGRVRPQLLSRSTLGGGGGLIMVAGGYESSCNPMPKASTVGEILDITPISPIIVQSKCCTPDIYNQDG